MHIWIARQNLIFFFPLVDNTANLVNNVVFDFQDLNIKIVSYFFVNS
jgi:hypothetical protein